MSKEEIEVLQKKAQYFLDNNLPVHIKYKKEYWKRGHVKEISASFFILNEFVDGEIPVFFQEIYEISKFTELKDD